MKQTSVLGNVGGVFICLLKESLDKNVTLFIMQSDIKCTLSNYTLITFTINCHQI